MSKRNKDTALVAFIYELIRDHMTFGEIERILAGHGAETEFVLSNPFQAAYARTVAHRLLSGRETTDES